jgi:Helix-turn-helix domain
VTAKIKWKAPGDPTKFRLYYPPAKGPRNAGQWDNWANAMMMDARLNSTDRAVLVRLALHYNLKTGACFPAVGRLAIESGLGESGWRTVQRTTRKAWQLGWINLTHRHGGPVEKSQTNLHELTLPQEISDILNGGGPALMVIDNPWRVIQATDGAEICGPFATEEGAETWIAEHGWRKSDWRPTRQNPAPTRQMEHTDPSIDPPITGKSNREVIEHSVPCTAALADATRCTESLLATEKGRKKASEKGSSYSQSDVEEVKDYLGEGALTVGGIINFARAHGSVHIDGRMIASMVKDGHLIPTR